MELFKRRKKIHFEVLTIIAINLESFFILLISTQRS